MGVLAFAAFAHTQSFDATFGSSELYSSSGLYTEYVLGKTYGWTVIAYENGMQFGGFYSVPAEADGVRSERTRLEIGDQPISGFLDVDEYDSHRFTVHGVSLTRRNDASMLRVVGGELTEDTIQPYLHFASTSGSSLTETPMGAVTYAHKFSQTLQWHSLNLFADKPTSIQSLGWKPSLAMQLVGAAGIGFGMPYASAVGGLQRSWIALRASYIMAGHDFHREEGPYTSDERLELNARVKFSPTDTFRLDAAHEHTLTYM
jgi:hypothetical protein